MSEQLPSVLINAYAISPDWGSEQGMGWHWMTEIARHCTVHVITEGQWRAETEAAIAKLPWKDNIHMYWLPVSDHVRDLCWNQGKWSFYLHYRRWQKRALELARKIVKENRIDIIHQLNMVGFREPGFLWKIEDIPFVWGPVGGMELMPMTFLKDEAPISFRLKAGLKNIINDWQRKHQPRVLSALSHARKVITATKGCADFIESYHGIPTIQINETGCDSGQPVPRERKAAGSDFNILWVGRFLYTKQLGLAIDTIAKLPPERRSSVKLHVVGTGSEEECRKYEARAFAAGVGDNVIWHGKTPHDKVLEMMRSADLFFFTSVMEATSTVVLEAIGECLPILCFDACGFGSIVDDTIGMKIPMTVPSEASDAFADRIIYAMDNPAELQRMSDGCPAKTGTLTWEYKGRKVAELYEEIL